MKSQTQLIENTHVKKDIIDFIQWSKSKSVDLSIEWNIYIHVGNLVKFLFWMITFVQFQYITPSGKVTKKFMPYAYITKIMQIKYINPIE